MPSLREAAAQALEALEMHVPQYLKDRGYPPITALRAALVEPVQEPVAWVLARPDGRLDRLSVVAYDDEAEEMLQRSIAGCTLVPLYPAPPHRKPLSEEEIKRIDDSTHFHESPDWSLRFARAVERAHEIT